MWNVSRQAETTDKKTLLASHVTEGRAKLNKPNNNIKLMDSRWAAKPWMICGVICTLWSVALPAISAPVAAKSSVAFKQTALINKSAPPCQSVQIGKSSVITLGQIEIIPLTVSAKRIFVGGLSSGYAGKPEDIKEGEQDVGRQAAAQTSISTGVADVDVVLLSPKELYLLGKTTGTMNCDYSRPE